jgi:hypothetical protein
VQAVEPLVRTILAEPAFGAQKNACDRLHAVLSALAELPDDSIEQDVVQPAFVDGGKAIAPRDAARCVLDFARTVAFMRGVSAAVAEVRQRVPRPVQVLYAGCGPFALLALPLVTAFKASDVQITLIDAHERSLGAAKLLFGRIGALEHVRAFIRADAATFKADPDARPHVLVIEAMQRALTREPQVSMTRQLAPQLAPGGLLVPERITVDACLADASKEHTVDAAQAHARRRIHLGTLLRLSKDELDVPAAMVLDIPATATGFRLQLGTTIQVFGAIVLRDYDSAVTLPVPVPMPADARRIAFEYQLGVEPGWRQKLE